MSLRSRSTNGFGPNRGVAGSASVSAPTHALEPLENRVLLAANAAPTLITPLTNLVMPATGKALTLGLDGDDKDNDPLTFTITSDDPNLSVHVPQGNRYAKLHFVDAAGGDLGDILIQLLDDRAASATAINRFVTLATNHVNSNGTLDPGGIPFYHDVIVHRVVPKFVIQTGDAIKGDGTGGSPLGDFADSFDPELSFAGGGVVAFANSGPNTNDSQFFITTGAQPTLNNKHPIFGQMISGQDVYNKIINSPRNSSDRPLSPPKLESVQILDDSPQDATVSFVPRAGWDGKAEVTVNLTDGEGHTTTKKITAVSQDKLGVRPTIPTLATQVIAPGTIGQIDPRITDATGVPLDYTVATSFDGVTANIDKNGKINLNVPKSFSGTFSVTVTAVEAGFAAGSLTPTKQTFFVTSQNPGDPPIASRTALASGATAFGSALVGNRLYVAAGSKGLEVYDVTNPASPTRLGGFDTEDTAREVKIVGNTAYVADSFGGLYALDVTNPAAITKIAQVKPPTNGAQSRAAIGFDIVGDRAYVAEYGAGLSVYDLSDNSDGQIERIGNLKQLLPPALSDSDPTAVDVVVKGQYALVSDARGAVIVVDVSDPEDMHARRFFTTGGAPWGLELRGDTLYVADQGVGLVTFNVNDPVRAFFKGRLVIPGHPYQVTLAGQQAIISNDDGFVFADISNSRRPREVYTFNGLGFGGIASSGAKGVALPVNTNGLVLLDGTERTVTGRQTFVDDQGTPVTVRIRGGGQAVVHTTDFWSGHIDAIDVVGATPNTVLTLTTPRGRTASVGDIAADGPMRAVLGRSVDLAGDVTIDGGLSVLALHDVAGDRTIDIGATDGAAGALSLSFGQVKNLTLESDTPIRSLTAAAWLDDNAVPDLLAAPSLGSLSVAGGFAAGVRLDDAAATLGQVSVGGAIAHGSWDVAGSLGDLKAGGILDAALTFGGGARSLVVTAWIDGSTLRTAGGVGSITAGGIRGSRVLLGVDEGDVSFPLTRGDFAGYDSDNDPDPDTSRLATLGTLTLRGIGDDPAAPSFADAVVAAWRMGRVSLRVVDPDNSGAPFGLAAGEIGGYRRLSSDGTVISPASPTAGGILDEEGDFSVRLV